MVTIDLPCAIVEKTREIFETMLFLPLSAQNPLTEKMFQFQDSVSAMLGFSGDLKGMLTVHCPQNVACEITSGLLGMEVGEVDEDVKDAIGELCNMVLGGLKDQFVGQELNINLAVPTVLAGRTYSIKNFAQEQWAAVPFALEAGEFIVELKYKES